MFSYVLFENKVNKKYIFYKNNKKSSLEINGLKDYFTNILCCIKWMCRPRVIMMIFTSKNNLKTKQNEFGGKSEEKIMNEVRASWGDPSAIGNFIFYIGFMSHFHFC